MKSIFIYLFLSCACISAIAQNWNAVGTGTNGFIVNTAVLDSVTHDIYIGGNFTEAGGIPIKYISKWNGTVFSDIGEPDNPVRCLEVIDSSLWAGGDFNTLDSANSPCIARWNGVVWENVGSGFVKNGAHTAVGSVYAIAKYGNDVYAGGVFDTADSTSCLFIARWDGTQWNPVGTGLAGTAWVYDMEVFNGELYVAGSFSNGGGVSGTANIAKWNGTTWSSVGGSASAAVYALTIHDGKLIAGGAFTTIGGVSSSKIAQWNGFSWSPLGSGMNLDVNSLSSMGGELFAGGIFSTAGGTAASRAARWDGTQWLPMGAGMDGLIFDLEPDTAWNRMYAVGTFNTADGFSAPHIAFWTNALAIDNENVFSEVVAFPNPTNDVLNIRIQNASHAETKVSLTDLQGRVVISTNWSVGNEVQLATGSLAGGMYLLSLTSDEGTWTSRIEILK
jgi:Secretion system C-terminal sorting domain